MSLLSGMSDMYEISDITDKVGDVMTKTVVYQFIPKLGMYTRYVGKWHTKSQEFTNNEAKTTYGLMKWDISTKY